MSQTPVDFMNLFIRPPGDLLYHLAVFGVIQAALFMALGQRLRDRDDLASGRYTLATVAVLGGWALMMVGALFGLLTGEPASAILPPMERLAHGVALVMLGWAFLTAESVLGGRRANLVVLILLACIIMAYIITGVEWLAVHSETDFNLTLLGALWAFGMAALAVGGVLLTLINFRHVPDAPLKLIFFGLILIGNGVSLAQMAQGTLIGDDAGLVRLTFVAALLLIPTVIYRMVIRRMDSGLLVMLPQGPAAATLYQMSAARPIDAQEVPAAPSGDRESAQLMRALGMILEKSTPENIPERIVTAALNALKADVGALLTVQDANYADMAAGVDRALNRPLAGISLNLDEQPTLVNAIERRSQRPLYPDRNAEELRDLYSRMDIDKIGPAYIQPLVSDRELQGVLLIGCPYAERELTDPELELLKGIAIIAANLLALSNAARDNAVRAEGRLIQALIEGVSLDEMTDARVMASWGAMRAELDAARGQVMQLTQQITGLKLELDAERNRLTAALGDTEEAQSISQRIIAMTSEQRHLVEERDRLALRLREAETALAGTSPSDETALKAMVDVMRREREELIAQRDRLQAQLNDVRRSTAAPVPGAIAELLEHMHQERARLEVEREALSGKLSGIEAELEALGIQGGAGGLTQLISQLYEQRASLQAKHDALKRERDALVAERAQLEAAIQQESDRARQVQALQTEVQHLASDREAILKQREKVRVERDELAARLESFKDQQSRLAALVSGYEQELTEAHEEENQLRLQIQQMADARSELMMERDRLLAEKAALDLERDQLIGRVGSDGADSAGSLMAMIDALTAQRAQLERDMHAAHAAAAEAQNQIETLQIRLSAQPDAAYQPDDPALIVGMVQEFRTPMTSVIGYVDVLLNESVGILGEMQRRFLQRIHANVMRLAMMLDDLIKITTLDAKQFKLVPEPVDVVELIEDAITNATNQLREKSLTVNLDMDDELPPLRADRDAISNIIGQLLTNAYLVSPPRSEITVTAHMRTLNGTDDGAAHLFVSVEDRGGGITPEDRVRVFARKYRAENPLIQGLGDTGVGLSIAKALVEAHGGDIWIESRQRVGTTIAFTLPFEPAGELER